jgi:hypothetical protein
MSYSNANIVNGTDRLIVYRRADGYFILEASVDEIVTLVDHEPPTTESLRDKRGQIVFSVERPQAPTDGSNLRLVVRDSVSPLATAIVVAPELWQKLDSKIATLGARPLHVWTFEPDPTPHPELYEQFGDAVYYAHKLRGQI